MVFDVMLNEGLNEAGKQKAFVYRVHGKELGAYLWEAFKQGKELISTIPLYPVKREFNNDIGQHVGDLINDEDFAA
jgi:hypothetical protein